MCLTTVQKLKFLVWFANLHCFLHFPSFPKSLYPTNVFLSQICFHSAETRTTRIIKFQVKLTKQQQQQQKQLQQQQQQQQQHRRQLCDSHEGTSETTGQAFLACAAVRVFWTAAKQSLETSFYTPSCFFFFALRLN